MKRNDIILTAAFVIMALLFLYMTWIGTPPEATFREYIRVFFQHIGPALMGYTAFGVTMICGVAFLWRGDLRFDILGAASIKVGILFTTITLLSGMIWANATWGVYWNWDPRETTTLILWIAYACLLVYRSSVNDREVRAQFGSIFGIVAFPAVILSYISIQVWTTLHPQVITGEGLSMSPIYGITLMIAMVAFALLYVLLLRVTYWVDAKHEKLMELRMSRS